MDDKNKKVLGALCQSINQIKKMGLAAETVDTESFLGGDLGIDSIEMLEIWYELEQALGVTIDDEEKRNIFTLQEVVNVALTKVGG